MSGAAETSERLSALFIEASALPHDAREAFLLRVCPDDSGLRCEVLSLLRSAERVPPEFLPGGDEHRNAAKRRAAPPDLNGYRLRGRYTIGGLIGEGGMAVVYEGEQDHPRRRVAVKIMRPQFVSRRMLRRFEFETDILARFDHPGIVRVLEAEIEDFGRGDGPQPYFVMEYVEGVPLTEYARERRLRLRDRLELFAVVCDAVQEAHQKGIIHRDLKPSNILVTADGQPKLLDFGIAKAIDPAGIAESTGGHVAAPPTPLTEGVQLIGTLQYMSPEQCDAGLGEPRASARADSSLFPAEPRPPGISPHPNPLPAGEGIAPPSPREGAGRGQLPSSRSTPTPQFSIPDPRLPVPDTRSPLPDPRLPIPDTRSPIRDSRSPIPPLDTRSDVYSLGALLYELLTERLPYDVSNMTIISAARTVCEAAPTPPSMFDRSLRGDLDAVILKALEKDRARRYASAGHLADDVRRHLAGEPTFARSATWRTRALRWTRKHPYMTTTIVCCLISVAIIGGTYASISFLNRRPHTFSLSPQLGRAVLQTVLGDTIKSFTAEEGWHDVDFGDVLRGKRAGDLNEIILLGGSWDAQPQLPRSLWAFQWSPWRQDLVLKWQRAIENSALLPDPFEKNYTASMFNVYRGWAWDVFPELPGDEIVCQFVAGSSTQSILRIYDLRGSVLYEVWFDGLILSTLWLSPQKLLVCVAIEGSVYVEHRVGLTRTNVQHPRVVFAFNPERGKRYERPLSLDPVEGMEHPKWCRMLTPHELVSEHVETISLVRAEQIELLVQPKGSSSPGTSIGFRLDPSDGSFLPPPNIGDQIRRNLAAGDIHTRAILTSLTLGDLPSIRDEFQDCGCSERDSALCPKSLGDVHGSPYRWARLLKQGRGMSGSEAPPHSSPR